MFLIYFGYVLFSLCIKENMKSILIKYLKIFDEVRQLLIKYLKFRRGFEVTVDWSVQPTQNKK